MKPGELPEVKLTEACNTLVHDLERGGFSPPPPPVEDDDNGIIAMAVLISYAYGVAEALARAKQANTRHHAAKLRAGADAIVDIMSEIGARADGTVKAFHLRSN